MNHRQFPFQIKKSLIIINILIAIQLHLVCTLTAQTFPDRVPFKVGTKYGYCTREGKQLVEARFDEADFFVSGKNSQPVFNPYAKVKYGGRTTVIDTQGHEILPSGFLKFQAFELNRSVYFLVTGTNMKKGIYLDGKAIVPVRHDDISWTPGESGSGEILFNVRTKKKNRTIRFKPDAAMTPSAKNNPRQQSMSASNLFGRKDIPAIRNKFLPDSIQFIEDGLAYIEKGGRIGFVVIDSPYYFKKNYTVISANLLTRFSKGCRNPHDKLLVTVQVGDKYILMNESESNIFNQEFTDTEGNEEFVVVKDGERIGFFGKNTCYPPIPTQYGKFIDPVWMPTGENERFLIYRVLMNDSEVLVGQNGVRYFIP